jgi:oligopeptide/dipeptide ABC transporter ATP-binding protein
MFLGLTSPSSGQVLYQGKSLRRLNARERRGFRRDVQIIFQDPFEVYNPFYRVDHLLSVPIDKFHLASSSQERQRLMESVLVSVGLDPDESLGRYPYELSGGQRQRIAIARVLLIHPRLIIADEPVSMVDASLRLSILSTLQQLNRQHEMSILYITHDLATALQLSENIVVLYRGSVVEAGDVEQIVMSPQHPYTQQLIDSIPRPDPTRAWSGKIAPATSAPGLGPGHGCKFADLCPYVMEACRAVPPPLFRTEAHRAVACIQYREATTIQAEHLNTVFKPVDSKSADIPSPT